MKVVVLESPNWIRKYIIGRKGANLKKFTPDTVKVSFEIDDKGKVTIEGPPEEVDRVQQEIQNTIDDYVANYSCIDLSVDSRHYKHIIGKSGSNGESVYIQKLMDCCKLFFLFRYSKSHKRRVRSYDPHRR